MLRPGETSAMPSAVLNWAMKPFTRCVLPGQ